jgi:hypothetical protein
MTLDQFEELFQKQLSEKVLDDDGTLKLFYGVRYPTGKSQIWYTLEESLAETYAILKDTKPDAEMKGSIPWFTKPTE